MTGDTRWPRSFSCRQSPRAGGFFCLDRRGGKRAVVCTTGGLHALYCAVRPMLAVSRGRLIALSTPFGKRGFFFEEWSDAARAWERIRITAEECPRISPD